MSEQIYTELEEQLGLNRKEIDETFKILDEGNEWRFIVRSGALESKTFKVMLFWTREKGGDYTTKPLVFHIPKEKPSIAPSGVTPHVVSMDKAGPPKFEPGPTEEDYSLTNSMKSKLGQLVPCLKDADGQVIDGFHRLKAKPDAWTIKLDHIKTPVDRALARMTVNFCRRHYTGEEMKNDVGLLIGAGYSVQQIAEMTGISERTIYRYMPESLKDQKISKATSEAKTLQTSTLPAVTPPLKTQDTIQKLTEDWRSQLVECSNCHMNFHKDKATIKEDKIFCPKCAPQIKIAPRRLEDELKKVKPGVQEKWEHRAAVMKPQKSHFEEAVIQELMAEGLPLECDKDFCVERTTPDFLITQKDKTIAGYIDCELTHKNRQEQDEVLREKLAKYHGFEILVVRYGADTKEEKERAKQQIREALKW